ncbi:MAG TPA: amidohydrolase family protein [Gaiellaceae bacterium]
MEHERNSFVLHGANVLDRAGEFSGPHDIGVVDGTVAEVGANVSLPDAVSIDFSDLFVTPGVFDCHLHIAASSLDAMELMRTPITQWTLEAGQNIRRTLEGGVTFVRDAAGADAGMREAVERGFTPGPRLQVAVVALSQTGGHVDGFLPGPGFEISADYVMPDYPGRPPYLVDGIEGMRRTVREVLRSGADWIKLCTTGGVLSAHDEGDVAEFTIEEIEVAVFEGARKRKGVMVHAFGGEGIDNAVRAGVRSVEHGIFLTEEQAALMAERGCYLVPTLAILRDVIAWAEAGLVPDYAIRKALDLKPRLGSAVRIAREAGVKIAMGTDYVERSQHGRNLEEILLMHQAGLTPAEALLAATSTGAELCGVDDRLGRIAPGYVFDAIVLDRDPSDLTMFAEPGSVTGVFKGGVPAVAHPRLAREAQVVA